MATGVAVFFFIQATQTVAYSALFYFNMKLLPWLNDVMQFVFRYGRLSRLNPEVRET